MGLPGKSRSSELKLVMRETHVSKSLLSAVCFFLKRDARLAAKKLVDTDTNMFSFFFYSEPLGALAASDTYFFSFLTSPVTEGRATSKAERRAGDASREAAATEEAAVRWHLVQASGAVPCARFCHSAAHEPRGGWLAVPQYASRCRDDDILMGRGA